MNFDTDDPLAGILSDGSDDSFFDDDILGKKKPAKKSSTPSVAKKNELFDLGDMVKTANDKITKDIFGTSTKSEATTAVDPKTASKVDNGKSTSPLPFNSTSKPKEALKLQDEPKDKVTEKIELGRSPAKSKYTVSDELDILDEPKKEMQKPLEKGKSSQSLLDDILGGPTAKSNVSSKSNINKPHTALKKQEFDLDSLLGKSESKQNFASIKSNQQKSTPVPKPETPKETQSKKKSRDDWLGIFQGNDDIAEEEDDADMPLWLVGTGAKKKKATSASKPEPKQVKQTPQVENDDVDVKNKEVPAETYLDQPLSQIVSNKIELPSTLKLSTEDVTMEGAALYLQQQESQIMVALQLKAQDEKLAAMQLRQKESQRVHREAAQVQHDQLEALLRRQAEHRQQMQAVIAAHQQRITQRIKSLLATNEDLQQENDTDGDYANNPIEKKDSPYTREKKQLLQLIQSLQENHDKEIDIMETSYRRQLAFLELSFNQAEERMKEESDKLVKFYSEKIIWLDEHHQLFKKLTEDNLNSLTERHKAENETLRQQHLENVRVLQEHHAALMENIKNAVKQEQLLIKDSANFSSDIQELLLDVKENKLKSQELVVKIESLTENTQRDMDRSLKMRETQITDMIEQLKMEKEIFQKEKSESKEIVNMLEVRLKQMTSMIEEELASLKQKKMEFEFEKATFSKQTEFAKNILKKQDEEIKTLKDDIQKEYHEKIAEIEGEKSKALKDSAIVAKEKAAVQRLKLELEKTKTELQAQLEEVTAERSKLNVEKQEVHMEEQRVLAKSRDLELLAKTAIDKQTQADKRLSDAEFVQRKYEERIRKLQEHIVSLNAREKQIAKEKVTLSRERLSLHNERKQIESRQQCSLCRSSQYNEPPYVVPDAYRNPSVSRDYGAMPSTLDVIEQEMAQLMGSSFRLRHAPELNHNRAVRADVNEFEDNLDVTKAESGTPKEYLDPKFMMLRLDVQQVISSLDRNKEDDADQHEDQI